MLTRVQRNLKQKGAWRRRLGAVLLGLLAVVLASTAASMQAQSAVPRGALVAGTTASPKDETVYVTLGHDGAVREVYVVNTFRRPTGPLTDYGNFSAVQNLSDEREIVVHNGRVEIAAGTEEPAVFRYQGRLENVATPWLFAIRYHLNGEEVTAEQLLGASGRLRMTIDVRPNPVAPSHFADRYTVQVTVPMVVDRVAAVHAPGVTELLVGNRLTLGFAVQPSESHVQVIEADVSNFTLPRFEISAFRAAAPQGAWRDNLESAFSGLTYGLAEMVAGSSALQGGLSELHTGVGEIDSSLVPLSDGAAQFAAALAAYAAGVSEFAAGLEALAAGEQKLQQADQQILVHLTALQDAYTAVGSGLSQLAAEQSGVRELANSLLASPDPAVRLLAQATMQQLAAAQELERGLSQANAGMAELVAGQATLAQEKEAFRQGLGRAATSATEIASGGGEIARSGRSLLAGIPVLRDGISSLYAATGTLPQRIGQLVAGQRQMLSGVRDARSEMSELLGDGQDEAVISFVDPKRANARSVQFVFFTPPLETERRAATPPAPEVTTTLWERIVELVRRVWLFGRESTR